MGMLKSFSIFIFFADQQIILLIKKYYWWFTLDDLETSLTQVSDVENVADIAALENISHLGTSQQQRTLFFQQFLKSV
jgi:hypothetical protein